MVPGWGAQEHRRSFVAPSWTLTAGLVGILLLSGSTAMVGALSRTTLENGSQLTPIQPSPTSNAVAPALGSSESEISLSPNSAGLVERTVFLNYNLSASGNFGSSVWNWQAGQAAVNPSTGELWIPTTPISRAFVPSPLKGPTIVYDPSNNVSSAQTVLVNSSAIVFDGGSGILYATEPLNNTVAAINASTAKWVGEAIPVGDDPSAIAYDSSNGEIYVANYGSGNVTVINGSSAQIANAGIPVGAGPASLAVDPPMAKLFVGNYGSENVTVIDTANNASQSQIPLLAGPSSLAVSTESNTLAVGMPSTSAVDVFVASTGATLSTVTLGRNVSALTVDSNGSEFIVASESNLNLSFINSSRGTLLTESLPLPASPQRLELDAASDLLYVWSNASREVIAVNLSIVQYTQLSPDLGVRAGDAAYDSASGTVLVTDRSSDSIDFLNATSLVEVRPPLGLPGRPDSIVNDPQDGVDYVGFVGGVEAIDPITGEVLADNLSLPGNNSDLVVTQSSGYLWDLNEVSGLLSLQLGNLDGGLLSLLDVGQVNLRGITFDTTTDALFVVDLSNSSIAVVNANDGIVQGWIVGVPDVVSVAFDAADGLVYALGDALYAIDPESGQIVAGPIDVGAGAIYWSVSFDPSRDFLYVVTSGPGPAFNGSLSVVDGSTLNSSLGSYVTIRVGQLPLVALPVILPGSLANGSGEIWVPNDASGTLSIVASLPEITYLSASPNPVDQNVATRFLLGYTGGAGPSTVSYAGLPTSCASEDTLTLNCTPTVRGTFNVTVQVVDSLGYSASALTVLSVSPALHVHLGLSATQLDLGMPLNATASIPSGSGTAPYSFAWTWGDGKSSKGAAQTHTYGTTGTYVLTVTATDVGGGVASTAATVTVVAAPQVGLSSSSPVNETDVDIPIQLNATVVGGTTPGTGTWNLTGGVVLHGLSVSHKFKTVGIYFANFTYVDASGYTVTKTMSVQVNPALSIKLSALPSTAPIVVGSSILFNVTISGGTAPYLVFWSFDDGSYASGISAEHSFASPGTYNVSLSVEDAAGVWQNSSDKVTVDANSTGHGLLGGSVIAGVFVGAVVGLALGTLILFLVGRRRRKTPPGAPQPYTTGGSTPPTTEGPSAPPESGAPTEWRED